MTDLQWEACTPFGGAFVQSVVDRPEDALLVFDFDGTLSRIVPQPEEARIVRESERELKRIASHGVQLAVVSGRDLAVLTQLTEATEGSAFANAILFGHYGGEWLDLETGECQRQSIPIGLGTAKKALAGLLELYPGSKLEDKGTAIAVHFRNSSHPEEDFLNAEDKVAGIASDNGLQVVPGRFVLELRGTDVTKGDALQSIIEKRNPSSVMFAGDDLGDIPAFDVIKKIQRTDAEISACVLVSASAEAPELTEYADVVCAGPDGVAAWVKELADQLDFKSLPSLI